LRLAKSSFAKHLYHGHSSLGGEHGERIALVNDDPGVAAAGGREAIIDKSDAVSPIMSAIG
jgi:hypothetical protein